MPRKFLLPCLLLAVLFSACATDSSTTIASSPAHSTAAGPVLTPEKLTTRNNAASLLFQLVEEEKNVSFLLVVKGNRPDVAILVKTIAATADLASLNLLDLAKADPSLNLHAVDLPAGEIAARAAIAKFKTHQLLLSGGDNFEFALLLSQSEALSYGYNLAQTAADNSSDPVQKKTFATLADTMKTQYQQGIAFIRAPAK